MKKFDPTHPWVVFQQTDKGGRYFTGQAHPTSPDAWTPDIRKAIRCTSEQIGNVMDHARAYTWPWATTKERAR